MGTIGFGIRKANWMMWLGAALTPVSCPLLPDYGGVPEWLKGADCKSAGEAFGGSNPPPSISSGADSWVIAFRAIHWDGNRAT
jgi:hypothetical protein